MAALSKVDPGKAFNIALIIVGSVAGLVALLFLFGKIKAFITGAFDAGKDVIDAGAANPAKQSYTQAQYKGWADQLYDTLDGIGSANIDTVLSILGKMNTYEDLMALNRAYGTRDVGNFTWDSTSRDLGQSLRWAFTSGWLSSSASDMDKINALLASKNINYTF